MTLLTSKEYDYVPAVHQQGSFIISAGLAEVVDQVFDVVGVTGYSVVRPAGVVVLDNSPRLPATRQQEVSLHKVC